jgi:hypothetical protein
MRIVRDLGEAMSPQRMPLLASRSLPEEALPHIQGIERHLPPGAADNAPNLLVAPAAMSGFMIVHEGGLRPPVKVSPAA